MIFFGTALRLYEVRSRLDLAEGTLRSACLVSSLEPELRHPFDARSDLFRRPQVVCLRLQNGISSLSFEMTKYWTEFRSK